MTEPDDSRRPAHGLYGPGDGILGTDIDLRGKGLDDLTIMALGALMADLQSAAEKSGFLRGFTAQWEIDGAPESALFLLFDNERHMWWGPNELGYVHDVAEAGRYSRDDAVRIALRASFGGLNNAAVIVADGAA